MTCFIAVANQKGGVAKTTTVVSLGGALAQAGRKVLVVDLDPQACLTLALGTTPAPAQKSITDVFFNWAPLSEVSRSVSAAGLDLVPSGASMELAERFLPIRKNYETILRSACQECQAYDYVLFDCPPSTGAVTTNALVASNLLLIPTQAEYFSAHALRNMMATVKRIRSGINPGLEYRILVTMLDRRNRIHRNLSEQLRETFGGGLMETIIEVDTKLRESSLAGLPVNYYQPHSRGAEQYLALSEEVIRHVETNHHSKAG